MSSGHNGARSGEQVDEGRRDFLRKAARAGYAVPVVLTFSVAEYYEEESGLIAQAATPPPGYMHTH